MTFAGWIVLTAIFTSKFILQIDAVELSRQSKTNPKITKMRREKLLSILFCSFFADSARSSQVSGGGVGGFANFQAFRVLVTNISDPWNFSYV